MSRKRRKTVVSSQLTVVSKLIAKLFFALLVPILIMLFVFIIDPLQFYRPATMYLPRFYGQERFQNPAIAHSFTYDTVVVGTSMSANVSLNTLRNAYGFEPIRQTFAGSSVFEQQSGLSVALRTGQVKKVIWELNFTSFGGEVDKPKDSKAIFPSYLYNKTWLDDFKYLLDPVQIVRAWEIARDWLPYNGGVMDYELEDLRKWGSWFNYSKEITMADFNIRRDKGEFEPTGRLLERHSNEKLANNIAVNVVDIVRAYPDVEWIFCFAPFSALEHVIYDEQGIFEQQLNFRHGAYYSLRQLENVRIFDFQGDKAIVEDLSNYKDSMHYSPAITNLMLYYMLNYDETTDEEFDANQIYLRKLVKKWKSELTL
ncbi:MAG: hypothetical protein FWE47_00810 [Oscillospiraceae bacterium]|nr:hypothetical protein [Oscillospiraceae bacterium]